MSDRGLAEQAAALLGVELLGTRMLSGGDLSPVCSVSLADGREVIAKAGPAPRVEAGMLRALGEAGARVPQVLAVSEAVLVMERLPDRGGLGATGWLGLGEMLRALHEAPGADSAAPYGWAEDYAFGAVAIPNGRGDDWPEFWAARRLRPSFGALPAPLAGRVERLADRIAEHLPPSPFPALLHGDLWAGNVLADEGRLSGLIDPACYYGDAEVDLAMLHLFGVPGPEFQAGYGPLPPGWQARRAVYQLWPALVHVHLFGAGYHAMVAGLLDRIGV